MISPTTLANLNPWPEKPAAIDTCGSPGWTSRMKCSSGLLVNKHGLRAMVGPSASGKYRRMPSRSTASSSGVNLPVHAVRVRGLPTVVVLAELEAGDAVRGETVEAAVVGPSILKTGKVSSRNHSGPARLGPNEDLAFRHREAGESRHECAGPRPAVSTSLAAVYASWPCGRARRRRRAPSRGPARGRARRRRRRAPRSRTRRSNVPT